MAWCVEMEAILIGPFFDAGHAAIVWCVEMDAILIGWMLA